MAYHGNPWTEEETQLALIMKANGANCPTIGRALGRSKRAVQCRFAFLRMTDEQLDHRNQMLVRLRGNRSWPGIKAAAIPMRTTSGRPAPAQIAERDERFGKPRTFAMLYLGDPLPGQSALDKRNRELSHG